MAVTSSELDRRGATGKLTSKKREYESVYLVKTDDVLDGPQIVLDYIAANVVDVGDTYDYGNDADSLALCTGLSHEGCDTKSDNPAVHRVVATFSTDATASGGIDSNGNPTTNPLDFRPDIQTGYQMVQRPVWKAIYRGGYTADLAALILPGQEMAPCSSALNPFDPPLEMEVALQRLSITINTQNWNNTTANLYINRVNSQDLILVPMNTIGYGSLVWDLTIPALCAKLNDYKPTLKRENVEIGGVRQTIDYISVTAEILIDPATWRKEVVDMDWHSKRMPGDPNGRGGTISMADLKNGMGRNDPIRGPGGDLAARKMLLDGNGQPLQNQDASDAVWLTWQIYEEKPLANAPVLTIVF